MRAAKVDANQSIVVAAMRKAGASIQPLHTIGQGVPDLLCAVDTNSGGVTFLVEVKDGAKPPSAQRLTPDQIEWHKNWKAPVYIVNSVETAIDLIWKIKKENEK